MRRKMRNYDKEKKKKNRHRSGNAGVLNIRRHPEFCLSLVKSQAMKQYKRHSSWFSHVSWKKLSKMVEQVRFFFFSVSVPSIKRDLLSSGNDHFAAIFSPEELCPLLISSLKNCS